MVKNNYDVDIDYIIDSIKIIEEQIKWCERKKTLFFQKKKINEYNIRIDNLENMKKYLYKRLENKIV